MTAELSIEQAGFVSSTQLADIRKRQAFLKHVEAQLAAAPPDKRVAVLACDDSVMFELGWVRRATAQAWLKQAGYSHAFQQRQRTRTRWWHWLRLRPTVEWLEVYPATA